MRNEMKVFAGKTFIEQLSLQCVSQSHLCNTSER